MRRFVIVSADVAGGHDAAARALSAQIHERVPTAEVTCVNGLALMGRVPHRVVRDGFEQQIRHARWSYRLLFRLCDARAACFLLYRLMPAIFGQRMLRHLESLRPDVVVSTYPLCSTVLGGLRRRQLLDARVVAIVTDVHPHRLWFAPGVDEHLVCAPGDVGRAARSVPWAAVAPIRPPTHARFKPADDSRLHARRELGLDDDQHTILVTGGSWGVGSLKRLVHRLDQPNTTVIVACGHNDLLRDQLERYTSRGTVLPIGYTNRMATYMHAADVVVATGAGLTVFEAIATRTKVVMASAIPGHGIRSARALHRDGLATFATRHRGVRRAVAQNQCTAVDDKGREARRELLELPHAADVVLRAHDATPLPLTRRSIRSGRRPRSLRTHRPVGRRMMAVATASATLLGVTGHAAVVRTGIAYAHRAVAPGIAYAHRAVDRDDARRHHAAH